MRYLLLILLFLSNAAIADCYVVTNLMTNWDIQLNKLGIYFGEFKDKEFRITIAGDKSQVSPGGLECVAHAKFTVECGKDVKSVTLSESEIEQYKNAGVISADADTNLEKFVYKVTKGVVEQIWHLLVEDNQVILMIPQKSKMKKYVGQIKSKC